MDKKDKRSMKKYTFLDCITKSLLIYNNCNPGNKIKKNYYILCAYLFAYASSKQSLGNEEIHL